MLDPVKFITWLTIAVAATLVAAFVGLFALSLTLSPFFPPQPFNQAQWKAEGSLGGPARCAMVSDLRRRVGLNGRTPAQVLELLGDDEVQGVPESYTLCSSVSDYWVLDLEWKHGRVASTSIHDT